MKDWLAGIIAIVLIPLILFIGVVVVDKTQLLCNRVFPRLDPWYRRRFPRSLDQWVYFGAVFAAIAVIGYGGAWIYVLLAADES